MCLDAIRNLLGGSDNSELLGLFKQTRDDASRASSLAADEAKKAQDAAIAAMTPAIDSESARVASERRMRKLIGAQAPKGTTTDLGGAPVSYATLYGA